MRFWKKDRKPDILEARLREERPEPDDELVRRLAADVPRRRGFVPGLRLAAAMALTALLLVPVAALGALSSPLDVAKQILTLNQTTTTGGSSTANQTTTNGGGSSGNISTRSHTSSHNQYQDKVTLCHRDSKGRGTTITVSQQAADDHFARHSGDTPGPCPPASG